VEDLEVLPRRVKHLQRLGCAQQREQRREVNAVGQRVDRRRLLGSRHLHEAELRPVGPFAHKLGVDCDQFGTREPFAKCCEFGGFSNQGHAARLYR
jgi:hypothetical protein